MKTLSDEHKNKISDSLRMRWQRGDFDLPAIREKWRQTALSGIAKKGRKNPNKFIPTQEMMDDYLRMGDVALAKKWDVSRRLIIQIRKEYNLPKFNNQHGLKPHEFRDGNEYKWCGAGHWELVENFGIHSSRYDGLRGHCKLHSNESSRKAKQREYSTPEGKMKIRIRNNMRKDSYILWEREDEIRVFDVFKHRCGYCGRKVSYSTAELDHFHPISKGGETVPSNMVLSCVECNRGVGGKKAKEPFPWLCNKYGEDIGNDIYQDVCGKLNWIAQVTRDRERQARMESIGDENESI